VQAAETIVRRVDGWLFAAEDARRLAAVRIGLCSALAFRFAITDYAARTTATHFQPLTYMKVFEHMPSPEVAATLRVVGIVSALLAASGLLFRTSLSVAILCSLFLNGMLNSAGRVIVGDALLTLCLIVLLAGGIASCDAWRVRGLHRTRTDSPARGPRYGWPIRTAMLTVSLAYFFAGLQKWRYSGLSWMTSDNLRLILYGQAHPSRLALFIADRPLLAHLFAAGALLLETCFPLVLFFPRLRWVFVPSLVAMHVSIRFAIRLDYSAQWLAVVIVFVDWPAVVDWVRRVAAPVPAVRPGAR
jgi:hypothetical protein